MWNGSRSGPRGGMPFRGNPRGEMFDGRNGPMPGFREREGMNMGAGPHDRPPMDMRRFDCPPDMMGQNMGPARGRGREFFRPGDNPGMNFRRHFEMEQNAGDFKGQGRPPMGMGGRDMQGRNMRGPEEQFMDRRDRDRFGFDMSPMDRRRLPMESMDRNDNVRERKISPVGMRDNEGFSMDMPSQERSTMNFERRRCPLLLNPRERFESDMDFRNRMGSPGDFRDRAPQVFRDNAGTPANARLRPDVIPNRQGLEKLALKIGEPTLRDREFPEQMENPAGIRGEDGKSVSDEWCRHSIREHDTFSPVINRSSSLSREMKDRFPPGEDGNSQIKDREQKPGDFQGKDCDILGISRLDRKGPAVQNWDNVPTNFPGGDAQHAIQKQPLLPLDPMLNTPSRNSDGKPWAIDEDKVNLSSVDQALKVKDMLPGEGQKMPGPREPQSNRGGRQDQDYRDIDYRTSSGQKYDYVLKDFQGPEKNLKEPKVALLEKPSSSGSQDQDYRSAGVQDKISKTIAISEIPKTATMQQILDAFAVRDGVPMQGMKIRNVVPGYSSDTAYVEFLNLEDAVHFMESNQGSVKVGSKTALLKYIQPGRDTKEQQRQDPPPKATLAPQDGLLPLPVMPNFTAVKEDGRSIPLNDPLSQSGWQRNSSLTPEAWQQQVDKELQQQETQKNTEEWANQRGNQTVQQQADPVFKESKTMIIKNLLPTTTLETILKALNPFAYLDEHNVRLVKGKTPGSKCFCFVDMDSHEQVVRLVDLLTKPRPITIDRVRVFAEVAKPLKNPNYRKDHDKSNTSLLGLPPDVMEYYPQPSHTAMGVSATMQGMCASADLMHAAGADSSMTSATLQKPTSTQASNLISGTVQSVTHSGSPAVEVSVETTQSASLPDPFLPGPAGNSEAYNYDTDTPDLTAFLYDATSGFYYDPQTTLYYDSNSRYFYNAQNQQYLYWDSTSKAYIPVDGSSTNAPELSAPTDAVAETVPAEELKTPPEGTAEQREDDEASARSEKKDKEKEDKPRSLAAFKIMKDMERWAKIQNRQKESVRSPSPVLKGLSDDKKASKAADAAFAVFERKGTGGDDLFKKPLTPVKKEEKGPKRPMGSLGMLAADYGAGSDEEEDDKSEKKEASPPAPKSQPQSEAKEDRLTDWKKIACLLCRRQFPSKDALVRHQQLSDLHKQNMEIHLKIKKSKKELEALESQEKEMNMREINSPPDAKRRKQETLGSSSRDAHKGSDRPGLGNDSSERKKKEPVWNYATYKQAVRKAMFARFKELE